MSWLGQLASPFILVMLLSELSCRRVMTTLVRPSAVCLPLNDRNVACVCTQGQINSFHSVLYMSLRFLFIEYHYNLIFSEIENLDVFPLLNLNPQLSYTSRVFVLTSIPAVCHLLTFPVFVCVSVHHLFCLWLLAWVIMCVACGSFTAWDRRGTPPTWGCCENVIV